MIHTPGGMQRGGVRFHPATQNTAQFNTHELCFSGISHLIVLDHGTETTESKTVGEEGALCTKDTRLVR